MSSFVEGLTHDQIADIGAEWVRRKGFPVAFSNMRSTSYGEQPDVLGFNPYGHTFLLEAKVSRSDFLSDSSKPWRSKGLSAIGDYRGFITPKSLLKPEEIPYGWWLLEVHGKSKPVVKVIKGVKKVKDTSVHCWPFDTYPHCDREEADSFIGANKIASHNWLIKVLQRAVSDGIDINKYAGAI